MTDEMKERQKLQYDGYHFGENQVDICNPFSILKAFSQKKYGSRSKKYIWSIKTVYQIFSLSLLSYIDYSYKYNNKYWYE